MRIIVVGGGIAGMGAADRLREAGHDIVLLEQDAEAGGRCRSVQWHGVWAVTGAFAFLCAETNLTDLARKLGIDQPDGMVDLTAAHQWNVLVERKRTEAFGAFDLISAAKHPAIPLLEKAKLLATLPKLAQVAVAGDPRDITSAAALDDVNACEYFRKFSPTFVDYFLEPCVAMFCGYGEDDYSLGWTAWSTAGRLSWSGDRIWSFKERGAGRITFELGRSLAADPRVEVRLGCRAVEVRHHQDGVEVDIVAEGRAETLRGDAVVMAAPGNKVAALMPALDAERRAFFDAIDYAGHHIVYYLLDRPKGDLLGTYVLPAADGFRRTGNLRFTDMGDGTTFAHSQWKDWGCRQQADASTADLLTIAWSDVVDALPQLADTRVIDSFISQQPDAICKRPKGYIGNLRRFLDLGPLPRVAFCGDYLTNSTVGQAHWSGLTAAQELMARL
ncbi:oxygen-dependent protoporphyrinogen oxidase [Rhodopseudomonas thermotolerans]|uniref:Oxygen-dependent protoporphyrinogen oxidase n=2 Tax=Rhodopseudomonas TaxID=1073 RepID=A0A336JT13_9BRAD|nr:MULTISPECIES: FAD-dependent oxidoreductase [Rhodopseudomonas]RED27269.1 oxygen-dependent protoporphyrinogen oxidase [Rhodopseudomonas pentothenatexigens]REF91078.1 oxygen-dependent protoporphyrinogen oxidase [Rhodopseudomonas thermotolerans]SSW92925.1 oxygen-dependent protoporphyrinogen oxidase [Rhodopseudomonas pentothenatexigens]